MSGKVTVDRISADRDDLVGALAVVRAETDAELNPDDPPPPVAELVGEIFTDTPYLQHRAWIARVDDEPAGELVLELELDEDNRELAVIEWLATRPRYRGRRVASALLRTALRELVAEGRTSVLASTRDEVASAWAGRLGLTRRGDERCSRLRIDDLDHDVVDAWLAEGAERSDGYRLVAIDGPVPHDLLGAVLGALTAMQDIPLDDIEWHPPAPSTDRILAKDERLGRRGLAPIRTLALAPDGSGAGYTELLVDQHRPQLAFQDDTGVVADHRGHGLGRWMKAENLRRALAAAPALAVIETYNAQSNPWMLDINVAMGFRPHVVWTAYQGPTAEALAHL